MQCPYCGAEDSKVINTTPDVQGGIRRRRECKSCQMRYTTYERPVLTTPLLVKHDGDREEFDREKLIHGIRMACAKRPVPAVAITRLADHIEAALQQMGADEVPSRLVGDMVVNGLRDLDEIAYIRYALIYLGVNQLDTIRSEIDRLLALKRS
jgi:transcriptional repressor NrdR